MPQPLPLTEVFAFRTPVVKDGACVLPVDVIDGNGRHTHGLRASPALFRQAAKDILAALEPSAAATPPAASPTARRPVPKPGGRML